MTVDSDTLVEVGIAVLLILAGGRSGDGTHSVQISVTVVEWLAQGALQILRSVDLNR